MPRELGETHVDVSVVNLELFEAALRRFLEQPTAEKFLDLRRRIVHRDDYLHRPATLSLLQQQLDDGDAAAVLSAVDRLSPVWSLCPGLHGLIGAAAEMQLQRAAAGVPAGGCSDDFSTDWYEEEIELRRFLGCCCLEGMQAAGRGVVAAPYPVTYPSDEADLLAAQGLQPQTRRLVRRADRLLEAVACRGQGGAVWFDVTELVASNRAEAGVELLTSARI